MGRIVVPSLGSGVQAHSNYRGSRRSPNPLAFPIAFEITLSTRTGSRACMATRARAAPPPRLTKIKAASLLHL